MKFKYLSFAVLGFILCSFAAVVPAHASQTKEVDIYVTSWCPYCKQAQDFLTSKNITFRTHDIEKDGDANAEFKKLGGGGIPLTKIGDRIVKGYNPDGFMAALG